MSISTLIHRKFESKAQIIAALLICWVISLICIVNLGFKSKETKAPTNHFRISDFISEMRIQADGDIFVSEYVFFNSTKEAPFKPFSRVLPLNYNAADSRSYKLEIELVDNFLYSGDKEVKVEKFKDPIETPYYYIMQIGADAPLPEGNYYYVYQYRIKHLGNIFKQNKSLKWNISGIWKFPIDRFDIHIIFPDGIKEQSIIGKLNRFQRQVLDPKKYEDILVQESKLEIKNSSLAEEKIDRDQERSFSKFAIEQTLAPFDYAQLSLQLTK